MGFDRAEFEESIKKVTEKATVEKSKELFLVRKAAVDATRLLGHPLWDEYQKTLQALVDQAQESLAAFDAALCDSDEFEHVELLKLKFGRAKVKEQIGCWNMAIDLPKKLMLDGEKAEEILESIDKEASNT